MERQPRSQLLACVSGTPVQDTGLWHRLLDPKGAMTADTWINAASCEGLALRTMFGAFMTGVTVVATRAPDGQYRAFTANSFTSVSLDPPIVLVCIVKSSPSLAVFAASEGFSISILGHDHREVSNTFASRDASMKAKAAAQLAGDEAPYVEGALAVMICRRERAIEAGDHVILLGEVERFRTAEGMPLGYFRGGYVGIGPQMGNLELLGAPLLVGGLVGVDDKVLLLRRRGQNTWELPIVPLAHGERHGAALHRLFETLGIGIGATVPYSLFQEVDEKRTTCVFTVRAEGNVSLREQPDGMVLGLFGVADAPWERIAGEMKRAMLQRYFREAATGQFGVYFDTLEGGSVIAVDGIPRAWSEWPPSREPHIGLKGS